MQNLGISIQMMLWIIAMVIAVYSSIRMRRLVDKILTLANELLIDRKVLRDDLAIERDDTSNRFKKIEEEVHEMKSFLEFNGYKKAPANIPTTKKSNTPRYKRIDKQQKDVILALANTGAKPPAIAKVMNMNNARIYSFLDYQKRKSNSGKKRNKDD